MGLYIIKRLVNVSMANTPAEIYFNLPLGVCASKDHVFLFYLHHQKEKDTFQVDSSRDGINFKRHHNSAQIRNKQKRKIKLKYCRDFRISLLEDKYFLTHKYQTRSQTDIYGALSQDLIRWNHIGKINGISETAILVPNYRYENMHVMYFGDKSIHIAFSQNLDQWEVGETVLQSKTDFFGDLNLQIGTSFITDEGILLFYFTRQTGPDFQKYSINACVFDKNSPTKLIRLYDKQIWESDETWSKKNIYPLGLVDIHGHLISYWSIDNNQVGMIMHPVIKKWTPQHKFFSAYLLQKLRHNPIIKPIVDHFWESKATFNPAAFHEDGKVHLVYRAIGDKDVSVLGYASSQDGINIDYRSSQPIYVPRKQFESSTPYQHSSPYSTFASGGGCYGGCEDPRITKIGDKLFMTYVAYNGWHHPRIALSSIKVQDFLDHKWNWENPVLISPPGVVDKNACIFPEKINDKYVILHRIFPNILIDFVDSLDFDGQNFLNGQYQICPRPEFWDSRKIGAGAPPIKTDAGWLVIYQAVGDQDPSRYKIGAMILDEKDPCKVLHRSNKPILEPLDWYENVGHKSGVAYPCGAVILKDKLMVYYGGADTVVCAASAPVKEFLNHLTTYETAEMSPIIKPVIIN